MRKYLLIFLTMITVQGKSQNWEVTSENRNLVLKTGLSENGELRYSLEFKGRMVVKPSVLGMQFKEPLLRLDQFQLVSADSVSFDQVWNPVWGEYSSIRNQYKELKLVLSDRKGSGISMNLVFRLFNEGLGFRYEFPKQDKLNHFIVSDELTGFALTGDHQAFWIPGDYDSNEFTYSTTRLSGVDAGISKQFNEIAAKRFFNSNAVQTPLMMKDRKSVV